MRRYGVVFGIMAMVVLINVCVGCGESEPETAVPSSQAKAPMNQWVSLFDGSTIDAWRMDKSDGWVIEGDSMTMSKGGSIWTKDRYGNFVLELEFKVSPECNSGVFFRTGDLKDPVQTGIEMQVLDSAGKQNPDKHDSGAMYDLLEPTSNSMKPAGEWNTAVITCDNNIISVDMNGIRIIEMDVDRWTEPHKNIDGTENKFSTALKDFPRVGHIGFQDHGHPVWYRHVRIKSI
ncbi:DUF1080 domain-containing protein [Candidatus Latescibacterota bacterium]